MEVGPELKLRPRRTKLLVLTGVAAAFCAIGLLMIRDGDSRGWFCLGFFSLCALIFLVQLVPGASYLKLDARGLTVRSLFRSTSYTWSEIVAFAPGRVGGNPGVVFNLTPEVGMSFEYRWLETTLGSALKRTNDHVNAAFVVRF